MNRQLQLRVRQSGVLPLNCFKDLPDGNLFIAEAERQVSFPIKRVYFINSLANPKAIRGKHAHRTLEQAIFCINGSFTLHLDDGRTKQRILLNDPSCGLRLGPMLWHTMSGFSYDCVILVLASDRFDEADYIRDYAEFVRAARKSKPKNVLAARKHARSKPRALERAFPVAGVGDPGPASPRPATTKPKLLRSRTAPKGMKADQPTPGRSSSAS